MHLTGAAVRKYAQLQRRLRSSKQVTMLDVLNELGVITLQVRRGNTISLYGNVSKRPGKIEEHKGETTSHVYYVSLLFSEARILLI